MHRGSIALLYRDVHFAIRLAGRQRTDPEVRKLREAVTDDGAEVEHAAPTEATEHLVVEARARFEITALDRQMVEHPRMLRRRRSQRSPRATERQRRSGQARPAWPGNADHAAVRLSSAQTILRPSPRVSTPQAAHMADTNSKPRPCSAWGAGRCSSGLPWPPSMTSIRRM